MSPSLPNDATGVGPDRRAVLRAAAWSAPVVALAVAAPLAAASTLDAGAYSLTPSCGGPATSGPGFVLAADPRRSLPTGTTVTVSVSQVSSIGDVTVSGGSVSVNYLSETRRLLVLTAPLAAGTALAISTTLSTSIQVRWTLRAAVGLPSGWVASGAVAESSFTSLVCRA